MAAKTPNILFIMGDDIGWFNISAYNLGIMGYRTPNIDRIAKEGALFTDWYGHAGLDVWQRDFTNLRAPKPFNLRSDPFERGDEGTYCGSWLAERMFLIVPAQAIAAKGLERGAQLIWWAAGGRTRACSPSRASGRG